MKDEKDEQMLCNFIKFYKFNLFQKEKTDQLQELNLQKENEFIRIDKNRMIPLMASNLSQILLILL